MNLARLWFLTEKKGPCTTSQEKGMRRSTRAVKGEYPVTICSRKGRSPPSNKEAAKRSDTTPGSILKSV